MCGHSPILAALERLAGEHPGKTALISGGERVTYARLAARIRAAAGFLAGRGLGRGDRAALSARKGLPFIYSYFAAHLLGAVNVVVDPESNPKRLAYVLGLTKPKLLLGFGREGFESVPYEEVRFSGAEAGPGKGLSSGDVADIVFTTGTTGAPKGVLLSHDNIYGSASNINAFIGNTGEDVEVLGLPLFHSFGLGRLRCSLIAGGTMAVLGGFANIPRFFAALEEFRATGFGMVPAAWAYIRKMSGRRIARYAPQIKYIEIGSAALPEAAKRELCGLFPSTRICHHYGLTEASRAAFMEYHEAAARGDLSTIGRPVCGKVSIAILDDAGRPVPDGRPGEICIRGNMVMKGYFKPEETAAAFFGDYFRTGDVGRRAAGGNFYLVGRKKELINVGGEKVSPAEIEDAILALGVEDCICTGIPDPGGILGEVPKAYILRGGTELSLDRIRDSLRGVLEPFKIPAAFEWIDKIPQTASGKKQRLSLKQPCRS